MDPALWHARPLLALASLVPAPLGALWMVLAPALPVFRDRRGLLAALTWFLTRVTFAVLVWGVLGHRGVDQAAFFLPQARHAMAGEIPYRDFASAYAPLFAPLLGLALRFFGETGPFALFLAADFVAWRALAAAEGESSECAWAYASMPVVWYLAVRYAQDEPLGAMFVALAWWAHRRDRPAWAGLVLGVGLVVTKPLFALLALPFLLGTRGRVRLVLAAAVPVAITYGVLLAWHVPVLQPFTLEGANFGVGPTLWRLPVVLGGFDLPGLAGWLPFAALAVAGAVVLARRREAPDAHAVWMYGAFAALSPKFMNMYAILWAPLLAAWAGPDPDRRGWLVLYASLLPLAWVLDSGPLQGLFGVGWRLVAIVGIPAIAALALWPLWDMWRAPRPAEVSRAAR